MRRRILTVAQRAAVVLALLVGGAVLLHWFLRTHRPTRQPEADVTPQTVRHAGRDYAVVEVDWTRLDLRFYWKRPDGTRYATFDTLASDLTRQGRRLLFATNAGIFRPDYTPCGLHVEDGRELVPLNLNSGTGNFYLKPNGVFLINEQGARIVEAAEHPGTTPLTRLATQSGPLLVCRGEIHPQFKFDSANKRVRSGVGVDSGGKVAFALSHEPVTFHEFAEFFRDGLKCSNALYLDGEISAFYNPAAPSRPSVGFAGILAVTTKD